jgi:predicted transposase YbfD/YdcC
MTTPAPKPSLAAGAAVSCPQPALPALSGFLAAVPDTRKRQGRRHPLSAVLCLVLAGLLAGRDQAAAIAEWGREYPEEVMQALGFRKGKTPCPSTLHLILKGLNWTALEEQLRAWAEAVLLALGLTDTVALAADGKTLRGSLKQGSEVSHLLSVVVHGIGITLSHEAISRKTNEITALPKVLGRLLLQGRVITVDALLTQRAIAAQIVAAGADYVMPVKGNQPALEAALAARFEGEALAEGEVQQVETDEQGHGRFEWRRLTLVQLPKDTLDWPGAWQGLRLERTTWRCRRTGAPRYESSTVYGVTSLARTRAGAADLLGLTRGHWTVENRSHWVRDCLFREDASQVATGAVARAMTMLRTAAISLLRVHQEPNLARARRRLQAHPEECLALLGLS